MLARTLVVGIILLLVVGSQAFWIRLLSAWARKRIPNRRTRVWLGAPALGALLFMFASNLAWFGRSHTATHMTLKDALLTAPFTWWIFGSVVGFLVILIFWIVEGATHGAVWAWHRLLAPACRPDWVESPARRGFLERTARTAAAVPFVAGSYGLLYGRINVETTKHRIRLARLPKAFDGFRIAQLSDIHIGPFMSENEIARYVGIANSLHPDLTVLTGDFVTWDPSTQRAVVKVLAGLRAPFGIFGCLGNHEAWSGTETSITRLFDQAGIRILRQSRAPIASHGEEINLIGVDFQTHLHSRMTPRGEHFVRQYLEDIEGLVAHDRVNILLSHNPNTFDRAAELGVDLSLAGHTHGGQVSLEFVNPALSPSRLITSYVRGWFEKNGAQLYVNRGIGTIGVPIRLDAPPEITLFELVRPA